MFRKFVFYVVSAFFAMFSVFIIYSEENKKYEDLKYSENLIKQTYVSGIINCKHNETVDLFYLPNENSNVLGSVGFGENVQILQDKGLKWYLVKQDSGRSGWIKNTFILIPKDPDTNNTDLKKSEIEDYVNYKKFESETDYFVLVEIDRQKVYIFNGQEGDWKLTETILCGTGKNVSPTTTGKFKIKGRGKWFYSERLGSGAMYWVKFNGSYLFHSVAMDKNKNIIDNTVGRRCSSGCVRMKVEDAKWFYENIPENTEVVIL